jgi:heme-degrading monooxygenase HmoA
MKRRTYLKSMLAGAAVSSAATAQTTARPILLFVDLSVDPKKEKDMLRHFTTVFRPAAAKQPGYLDVKMLKFRSTIMGKAPAGVNYRFALTFESEELRQKWIKTDVHQQVWPPIEGMLTTKDYSVHLFDAY